MQPLLKFLRRAGPLVAALALVPVAAPAVPLLGGLGGPAGYGTNRLVDNDDGSSASIDIRAAMGTMGVNFFGTFHTAMYVNNNGNITFRGPVSAYTPTPFPIASQPMIAPFWGDVDTRPGTPAAPVNYGVYYDVRPGQVVVTWHNVGFFSASYTRINDFQLILRDQSAMRVAGDFDVEFRYNRCEWMAGTASGSDANGQCAPGSTTCTPAQAGFDAGNQMNFEVLPGSRTPAVLNLCTLSNVDLPGVWRFQIRGGGIAECGNGTLEMGEECDDNGVTPGDGCSASCRTERPNGGTCMQGDQCRSGFCVDGVCCNVACNGQCEACNATNSVGTCTAVTGTPVGGRTACTGAGSTCGGTCNGTLRSACTFPATTTSCGAASCANGTASPGATCNGAGACGMVAPVACAPYVCGTTTCRTDCTTDQHCTTGNYCNSAMRCVPRVPNGGTCTAAGECTSGNCVDGVCCGTACNGQCEACNVTGSVGTCAAVTGAPRGTRTACAGTGTACGGTCNGTDRTACTFPSTTTTCRPASCSDGVATLAASCDGMGACTAASSSPCAPYACGESGCATSCTSNEDCAPGNLCMNGMCTGLRPNGGMCGAAGECQSGNCVDGICCNTACNGQCEACDVAGSLGTCSAVTGAPHGQRTACMGEGTCASVCDGTAREACAFPGSTRECRAAACADGVATAPASCDGMGACPAVVTTPCSPYTCADTACRTACTQDSDCAMGFTCTNGMCGSAPVDAGPGDAGPVDASNDSGTPDAGTPDAGTPDAGTPDAGQKGQDSGTPSIDSGSSATAGLQGGGCNCTVVGGTSGNQRGAAGLLLLGLAALVTDRRRRAR